MKQGNYVALSVITLATASETLLALVMLKDWAEKLLSHLPVVTCLQLMSMERVSVQTKH